MEKKKVVDKRAGRALKRARLARGMTQAQVAGDKYSAAYVSTVESGNRGASDRALVYFCAQMGTTPELIDARYPRQAGEDLAAALFPLLVSCKEAARKDPDAWRVAASIISEREGVAITIPEIELDPALERMVSVGGGHHRKAAGVSRERSDRQDQGDGQEHAAHR